MIPGPEVAENKLSDAHRADSAAKNFNMNTGFTVVPIIVDEAPEVIIDEESDIEI